MNDLQWTVGVAAFALLFVLTGTASSWAQVQRQAEVSASGGTVASNGSVTLRGTVGQVAAQTASSSSVTLSAGFWPAAYLSEQTATDLPGEEDEEASEDEAGSAEELPTEFALEAAYPNPFNPLTHIRYALPEAAEVRLAVYNTLGQRVETLVDRRQTAGHHEVAFRAGDLPSGTYYYRIRAGSFAEVRAVTLLK